MEAISISLDPPDSQPVCDDAGTESELIDKILTTYQNAVNTRVDLVRAGSLLTPQLAHLLKERDEKCTNSAKNGLILLLALFFLREDQNGLRGKDLKDVSPHDKAMVIDDLVAAISDTYY